MKIKMNYTKTASPDGVQIESYEKDKIYTVGVNITPRTADVFIKNRRAIIYIEPVKPEVIEEVETLVEKKKRLAAEKKAAKLTEKENQAFTDAAENKGL